MFHVPEKYRVRKGPMATSESDGNNGAFVILTPHSPFELYTLASDGLGWEHVSVSTMYRCPTWEEMAYVKSLFWDDEDCVMQLHPPRNEYVNNHPYCLHLWRPIHERIPMPSMLMVGVPEKTEVQGGAA